VQRLVTASLMPIDRHKFNTRAPHGTSTRRQLWFNSESITGFEKGFSATEIVMLLHIHYYRSGQYLEGHTFDLQQLHLLTPSKRVSESIFSSAEFRLSRRRARSFCQNQRRWSTRPVQPNALRDVRDEIGERSIRISLSPQEIPGWAVKIVDVDEIEDSTLLNSTICSGLHGEEAALS